MVYLKAGLDFVDTAKKYSDDPNAATDGGDLGTFRRGDMLPEIEDTVMKMKPGEVSELVMTPAGFHIIKLESVVPGAVRPFDEVKGEIEEQLYRRKSEERFNQWVAELKKSAAIDIR
jgi:peptidyl-prolyl cis-trans isomerase SurA